MHCFEFEKMSRTLLIRFSLVCIYRKDWGKCKRRRFPQRRWKIHSLSRDARYHWQRIEIQPKCVVYSSPTGLFDFTEELDIFDTKAPFCMGKMNSRMNSNDVRRPLLFVYVSSERSATSVFHATTIAHRRVAIEQMNFGGEMFSCAWSKSGMRYCAQRQ